MLESVLKVCLYKQRCPQLLRSTSYRVSSNPMFRCACSEFPGASDDPSSCVMVCATPTRRSDLKTKERRGQLSASMPRNAYPLPSPFPQTENRVCHHQQEKGKLCQICLPSDKLWLVTQPSISRCHSGTDPREYTAGRGHITSSTSSIWNISLQMLMNWKQIDSISGPFIGT